MFTLPPPPVPSRTDALIVLLVSSTVPLGVVVILIAPPLALVGLCRHRAIRHCELVAGIDLNVAQCRLTLAAALESPDAAVLRSVTDHPLRLWQGAATLPPDPEPGSRQPTERLVAIAGRPIWPVVPETVIVSLRQRGTNRNVASDSTIALRFSIVVHC